VRLLDAKKLEPIVLKYIFNFAILRVRRLPQLIMRKTYLHFFLLGLFGLSVATANAAQLASAKVLSVSGTVTSYTEGGAETPLQAGAILTQGASICTKPSSQAELVFSNGSELTVMENSRLTLAELSQEAFGGTKSYEQLQADPSRSQTLLKLNYGKTSGHVKKLSDGSQFLVESPLGTAAIRGTNFTIALNFNPTTGLYSIQVSNHDGLVDLITKAEGSKENGDYDPNAAETSTPIPAGQEFAVSISADDPNFGTVIEQMINLTATAAVDGTPATGDPAVIAPTAAEIQLTAEIVMMAFMAGIQADPTIDADKVSSVIANVSSAVLSATVTASGDASPEAIAAASKGIVGAAAAASSGTDSFAATVAAASGGAVTGAVAATAGSTTSTTDAITAAAGGAVTGAVTATAGSTTSTTDAITAASGGAVTGAVTATAGSTTTSTDAIKAAAGGAVTGAVAATAGSTTSSTDAIAAASNGAVTGAVEAIEAAAEAEGQGDQGDDDQGEDGDDQGEDGDDLVAAAAQAATSGATEAAVNSAEGLDDQLAALQAATSGATQAALATGDDGLADEISTGATEGATEAGLDSATAEAAVENAVQVTTNNAEGEDQGNEPVITPDVDDTEDDDTTVTSPAS